MGKLNNSVLILGEGPTEFFLKSLIDTKESGRKDSISQDEGHECKSLVVVVKIANSQFPAYSPVSANSTLKEY